MNAWIGWAKVFFMILFQNDWGRYPTAIVDYDTSNKSFLRLASLLRDMGVQNCLFPLALIQPALKGVDPHGPNLTDQQKVMIGLECEHNPWYYLREVVRIPPIAGPVPISYIANRGNIALTWSFLCNVDFALIQPRQTGKSVSTDCLMVWLLFIGASNTLINMITKDDSLRKANIERLKRIRDLLPKYLFTLARDDSDNQFELTYKALDNVYRAGVSQNSESTANNLGRGLTSPVTHIDEGPFIKYIGTTLPAALASGNTARQEAKAYGRPYGNIFTTTAGKKDDRDGRYMYDMISDGAVWQELFYDSTDRVVLNDLITRNRGGRKQIINGTFSHRQLGYTDEWLYEAMSNAGSSGEAADRDFFNIWTSGTQSSPLSPKLNETIRESKQEILHQEITKDLYIIRWYCPEDEIEAMMASGSFILGLDTSDAVGRDCIGGTLIDTRDLSTVAAMTFNETNLIRFANFLADFMIRYPTVTLNPERKSTGAMIIDNLLLILPRHGVDPFRRIFNSIVHKHAENPEAYKEICQPMSTRSRDFYDMRKKHFGFVTTSELRLTLYSTVLQNAAKKAGHVVRDKVLVDELLGLVVKNGRIDHTASGHDDHVIAWLLAQWLVTLGHNLQHYGIDTSKALSGVSELGRALTFEETYAQEQQRQYRLEIEKLCEELGETADLFIVGRLEARLKTLSSRLTTDDLEAVTVDALISQAAEQRTANASRMARERQRIDRGAAWGAFERPSWRR